MRLFYLTQRGKSGVWYVALRDESGTVGTRKSTNTTNRREAEAIAQAWLRDGSPEAPRASNQPFCEYLTQFWDYDTSPYFQELLTMGKEGHRRHALDMQKNVRCYFVPYFGDKKLRQVNEEALQDFLVYLKTKKGLAASTVNKARNAAFVAIRYAKRRKLIGTFDFDAVLRAGGKPKGRGILEREEVERLFSIPWRDERSRLINLIASQTAMRMGEIRALRICDILSDRIRVSHAWSYVDGGLKCPKNGESREIPLLPDLSNEIGNFIEKDHPFSPINSLLFPGLKPDIPFDEKQIVEDLYKAMTEIGIQKDERTKRNIVFHSWRHYCAKNLASVTTKAIGMAILGHKTSLMFDHYADHKDNDTFIRMRLALEAYQSTSKKPSIISLRKKAT